MAVLSELKPERVFYYFEEICKIPHGSYHTKQISDYLVEFAKKNGLSYRQDESNNVIIRKPAAAGYEEAPTVILQGHCDMVCEKIPGSVHDFEKDGLSLIIEGDYITADGTTLGGDDGIAVAYGLAIMEDASLKHPALELVITTDEEVGLLGATSLDASDLKGRYLINMDSEEEGYLWISCAGGLSATSQIPVRYEAGEGMGFRVTVEGLTGGHSGAEIDKIRANSNKLMGRFLFELKQKADYGLAKLQGGQKDNAIPRTTEAVILMDANQEELLMEMAGKLQQDLRKEYSGSDGEIQISVEKLGETQMPILHPVSLQKIVFFLVQIPYGIQKMSGEIPGLVETSINPGILELDQESCKVVSSIRSSVKSAKEALTEKLIYLTEFLGGTCVPEGDYPAWEYKKESRLREIMVETYEELFGEKPEVKAIHAGLECGLFYEKIPGLDCVSFGPNMQDIHTTEEKLSISSTARMWEYLLKVLENIRE